MSRELTDIAKRIVEGAQKRGAQGARASAYRSRESTVEWRDGKLDRLKESTQMGAGVTLYVGGRYSANSTCDLRPEALERFLDDTVAMTKVLAADPHRKLPDIKRYEGRFAGDLLVFDAEGLGSVDPEERRRTARFLEEAARSAPGADAILSVTTSSGDDQTEAAMVASNGLETTRRASSFALFAKASVKDQGDRKPEGYWYGVTTQRKMLPSVEKVGQEATRRALFLRGSRPEKSGQYPCVVENSVAGRLIGDLLAPLSGNAIQQKRSYLAGKSGQELLSPKFSMIDDPLLPGGLGSRTYDNEGMTLQKLPLFEKGKLQNFLLDTYYASKLGVEPTTGSATNLIFSEGDKEIPALLKAMGTGLFITGFSGGNSNAATGDFSLGVRGLWVENGEPVRAVSEMNLAGNHLQFWKRIAEMGGDPYPYSSIRVPSLRFDPVQFSGT
jgi:PmbA protein